jgi:tRNA (guanine-N7-)-methyltransferase
VGKKKLIHFQENLTFPFLFQPPYPELYNGFPLRGNWNRSFFQNDHPVIAELGCGKGEYTVGLGERNPAKNYIGIDLKGARLWRGCKSVVEKDLKNIAFVRTRVDHILRVFGTSEIDELWITFPDPQPKKERLRLTSPVFIERYREVLRSGGLLHLKTDDRDFYQYSLEVAMNEQLVVLRNTEDLYHDGINDEVSAIQTFYEAKWLEMNKKICYLLIKFPVK